MNLSTHFLKMPYSTSSHGTGLWNIILIVTVLSLTMHEGINAQLSFSNTVPAEINVCEQSETFTFEFMNNGSAMSNVELTIDFPTGINYLTGSLNESSNYNVAISNAANPNSIILSTSNIPNGGTVSFDLEASAGFDAIAYHESGNLFRNNINVSWNGGSQSDETEAYNLLEPALSITVVSPMSQSVFAGESFIRTVTIVNGGYGNLSSFNLKNIFNNNLQLDATDVGILSVNEVILSGNDFQAFGNGDTYFDRNEILTLNLSMTAIGCNSTQSQLVAEWGCDGQTESSNSKYPYTTIQLFAPDIDITVSSPFNTCVDGSADVQSLTLSNDGTGPANEVEINISQEPANVYSAIETGAITYTVNGGSSITVMPDNTTTASPYACLSNSMNGSFTVTLPAIQPNDEVVLSWNSYTCDTDVCTAVNLIGWEYEVTYTDMCNQNVYEDSDTGQELKEKNFSVFNENPSDLVDGQIGEYLFILTSATFDMPEGTNPHFEVVFDIPQGLLWSGNTADLQYLDGPTEWAASSVNYNPTTRQLTAVYDFPIPFNLRRSEFHLNLTADCADSGGAGGWVNVGMQMFYIMDTNCSTPYRMSLTCFEQAETLIHCPGNCSEGMVFNDFTVERTSIGAPDNNLDGLPDNSGSLDLNKVRLNRVMANDTFQTTFRGTVKTSGSFPSFDYGYARSLMPYGAYIDIQAAEVIITDAGTGQVYTCNVDYSSSIANTVKTVDFDYSVSTLIANNCALPAGFKFEDNDQVELIATYKVVGNIGGNVEQVTVQNQFYLSNTANGTAYQCNVWNGNFTIIGYYFLNYNSEVYRVRQCTRTISQGFYMSVGNCCTNYSGGDLFPYEYRNWGNIKDLRVEIPEGYSVVAMSMHQDRTLYTNGTIRETVSAITPTSINGQTYIFDLEQYYTPNGGPLNLSDDGFNGVVNIEVDPVCTVNTAGNLPMEWHFTFRESDFLGNGITNEYSGQDYIRHYRGDLKITTTQQTQEGLTPEVSWQINVKNSGGGKAFNSWIFPASSAGDITITEVLDLSNSTVIAPVNGFYQLGNLNINASKNLRITGVLNSCNDSELLVTTGYDCDGYPTDINSFNCATRDFPLYVAQVPSELQTRIRSYINPGDVCTASIGIEVDMLSAKLASVKDLLIEVNTPGAQNIAIEPGSVSVKYPISNNFTSISDPALIGNTYTITGADMSSIIGQDGLVGLTDITMNEATLKFNLKLGNDFQSGDFVELNINGKRVCGDALPETAVAFDPNAVFEAPNNIGLSDIENSWAASWADYDNDGFVDLFTTNYDTNKPNILYKNNGDGTFSKINSSPLTTDLASSLASTWGDYDNDGDLDLYVANNIGFTNFLYRNEGNGSFTRIQNDPAVNDIGYAHGTSWVDYDNDGFLDLFVADFFSTKFNQLYHNNGDGTFTRELNASPVLEANFSVSGVWGDYNNDGYPDLFVANTNDNNNSLYKNMGNGSFLKINTGSIVNDGGNSVGASWADYDNDGFLDLFVSNSGNQNNFLYNNNGDGTFTKITAGEIVNTGGHSHGSAWSDLDNDGDMDLFVANDQDQDNLLYSNNGDGTFTVITNVITQDNGDSFGAAWADYDNDGDPDLFVANHELNTNFVYENTRGKCQSNFCILLAGTRSNASGIGAKIRLKANVYGEDLWQMKEVSAQTGGGVGGQSELKTIFGLGDAVLIDSIIVEWPSGYQQILTDQPVNDCLTIQEEDAGEVCGTVYFDENQNCLQDAGEPGLANIELNIQPGNISVFTDENGDYLVPLAPGSYTVSHPNQGNWAQSCPNNEGNHSVSVQNIGDQYCGYNFGDRPTCAMPDLKIGISATPHRVGFENLIAVHYENAGGQVATNVALTISFDEHIIPMDVSVPWDQRNDADLSWNLGNLEIGASGTIYITDSISTDALLDEELVLSGSINGSENDCNAADNTMEDRSPAIGALDPNDILVFPEGAISNEQILTYKIRFQNVGNATVNQVRLENQLPDNLDHETLELGVASHPYRFEKSDDGKLLWTFDNILLPDSTTNEVLSHGYVIYRINLKPNLETGDVIKNQALIFFDNNNPIATNVVENNIINPADVISAGINIRPNPTKNYTTISIKTEDLGSLTKINSLQLFDATGRKILVREGVDSYEHHLNLGSISSGVYIVFLIDEFGKDHSGKLVIY